MAHGIEGKFEDFANKRRSLAGIEFVPLHVPYHRRRETFAVAFWVFVLFVTPGLSLLLPLYLVFYTSYWWLVALYLVW